MRAIKIWARARKVDNHTEGTLRSISLTVMLANIKGSFNEVELLSKFFEFYDSFDWAEEIRLIPQSSWQTEFHLAEWGRGNDRQQMAKILTPCFPTTNSAYDLTEAGLNNIKNEFNRANKIMKSIHDGNATWADLFREMPTAQ